MALNWENIFELGKNPLVTLGVHTVNHIPLSMISEQRARGDILESKQILKKD